MFVSQMILGTFKDGLSSGSSSKKQTRLRPIDSEDEDSDGGEQEDRNLFGWIYIGSHNFTPSAWGTLSGSASHPVLNVGPVCSVHDCL